MRTSVAYRIAEAMLDGAYSDLHDENASPAERMLAVRILEAAERRLGLQQTNAVRGN